MEKEFGKEYLNPEPVEIPLGLKQPESMDEKIKRIIATQISAQAVEAGAESFDEANDFDVKDDFESDNITSRYEMKEMTPEYAQIAHTGIEPVIEDKLREKEHHSEGDQINPPKNDDNLPEDVSSKKS